MHLWLKDSDPLDLCYTWARSFDWSFYCCLQCENPSSTNPTIWIGEAIATLLHLQNSQEKLIFHEINFFWPFYQNPTHSLKVNHFFLPLTIRPCMYVYWVPLSMITLSICQNLNFLSLLQSLISFSLYFRFTHTHTLGLIIRLFNSIEALSLNEICSLNIINFLELLVLIPNHCCLYPIFEEKFQS
jgi:hypothetical protein